MNGFSDERREYLREELLDSGRKLFARYGLKKTTTTDLTALVSIVPYIEECQENTRIRNGDPENGFVGDGWEPVRNRAGDATQRIAGLPRRQVEHSGWLRF